MKNRKIAKVRLDTLRMSFLQRTTGISVDVEPKDCDGVIDFFLPFSILYNLGIVTIDTKLLEEYIKKEGIVDDDDDTICDEDDLGCKN